MNQTSIDISSVDWNFSDAPTNSGVHAIHPYPAKFIPQIPRKLIELFHPGDSSTILDPFCGSGTSLVEAIDWGLDAWGIDLNPLACLIAKVKTTPLSSGLMAAAKPIISKAHENLSADAVRVPPIPRVDHWFKPDVQKALASLIEEIGHEDDPHLRDALEVALSSIIVQVSNQESDTRYAAIDKGISAKDVFVRFERAVATVERGVASLSNNMFRRLGKATILNQDILTVTPAELPTEIGLVVTSPPYPNAYEYWLYHKYRMFWLGMDPIKMRKNEIGARPNYFKVNHQGEKDFERQMSRVFSLLANVMKPKGKACFLIGRSIIRGRVINNAALLKRVALSHGFVVQAFVKRRIPPTRKAFNPAHSKINQEHLIVFSLETTP